MKKTNVSKVMLKKRKPSHHSQMNLEELRIRNKHELDLYEEKLKEMDLIFNQKMKELRERQDLKLKEQEKIFEEKIKQQKLDFAKRDKELAEDFAKQDKIYEEKKRQQLLDFEKRDKNLEEEFKKRDKNTEEKEKKHEQNREIISDIKDLAISIIKQAPSLLIDSFTIYHNYQTVKKEPDPYKQDQMIQNGFLFRNVRDDDFVGNGRTAI